ncbi:NAD(P)/FAD-dependent oxidoreductase [Robiginitalea sediminis]|uniref:NAD(P)/FAD-dependent oxidoreductase n=1 Tax=Robiginitalea sediminis TaxID=1982593 RepID=UPI000B4C0886|nr:FAD-dependent oxidoreductase [Robiginitalea sediminis]
MELSHWEYASWFSDVDYCVVGSGITGLSCALELKRKDPGARVLVLERGVLPQGASTKNAGFACFGSLTEILEDLQSHSEDEVATLVAQRYRGIRLLRERLGDAALGYQQLGGYEVFPEGGKAQQEAALDQMSRINTLLKPVFGADAFETRPNSFGMAGIMPQLVLQPHEGQIDTGKTMKALLSLLRREGVEVLSGLEVLAFEDAGNAVQVQTPGFSFQTRQLLLATNGFAGEMASLELKPARAQVLITRPMPNLKIRGCFHLDAGYYYFRNVGDRVLFGGGRNLDKEGETTTNFGQTTLIQQRLEELLETVILPDQNPIVERRWSGIMGVGPQKRPIISRLSARVSCGVRLGGMGVAIGSEVGTQLAALALEEA